MVECRAAGPARQRCDAVRRRRNSRRLPPRGAVAALLLIGLVLFPPPSASAALLHLWAGDQDATIFGAAWNDGASVTAVADLDGEGGDDLLIGAPYADGSAPDEGAVYLFLSRPDWPAVIDLATDSPDTVIQGAGEDDRLQGSDTGDLDGDTVTDLVLRAPGANLAYVFFGRPAWPALWDLATTSPDLGITGIDTSASVLAADVTGDGVADLLVEGSSFSTRVRIFFGRPAWPAEIHLALDPPDTTVRVEGRLLAAGGVTGDGSADLVFGHSDGRATILFARSPWPEIVEDGWDRSVEGGLRQVPEALVADVIGDGVPDLALSEPMWWNGDSRGRVRVFAGGPSVAESPPDLEVPGLDPGDELAVAGSGDLDGDGRPDLLLVAPKGDGARDRKWSGEVYALLSPLPSGTLDLGFLTPGPRGVRERGRAAQRCRGGPGRGRTARPGGRLPAVPWAARRPLAVRGGLPVPRAGPLARSSRPRPPRGRRPG